ncbi:MAG: indolepyruvate ferredoxin oxidoreductase subunit alpha [Clostridiales bacterium]|jgi:indolepyruvate ferredoxin oxidoreductase alpha subunit|nr:indolepyruvate ferredoxin oxidoreductase subunit alpha [Clostridiales bacterium]
MAKKLLMGNEAIALGAIRAGVRVVTGYPGTPSSEVLETVAKNNSGGQIYVEWSVNEKAALEVAAGAAYSGARALVTMKQVGLNVASDPLMSLNYVGVKGGLVLVVADDPGPISSQTEQDTRRFAGFAKLALFDPSSPEEAYEMAAYAFAHSERYGRPVILRPTTRVCHSCASVEISPEIARRTPPGFEKSSRWTIFPKLVYENHQKIEDELVRARVEFSNMSHNFYTGGNAAGKKGIAAGGVSYAYVRENLKEDECKLLKISTVPFPDALALKFLDGLEEVLVAEELDPVIEDELVRLCGVNGISAKILGKRTGHMPRAGENTPEIVANAVSAFLGNAKTVSPDGAPEPPRLPVRPPVLCAGCPHRASFHAVKEAVKGTPAVFSGDIGCYTLGNAQPLDMVDTCLCMGAGVTVAQGLQRMAPEVLHFAFIGDSTFFHSGITGIVNAVYNQTDIIVAVLDNSTTAMTGSQPHPGTGVTMMGGQSEKISIEKVVRALGVSEVYKADPLDQKAAKEAVRGAAAQKGVRVLLFESPCIALLRGKEKPKYKINPEKCTGCTLCVKKLGCPAVSMESRKAYITPGLCAGCGLCAGVCPAKAILSEGGGQNV